MAKAKAKPAKNPAPKAVQFSQTFFKPGRYHVGHDRYKDYTAEDLKASALETSRMMADGHAVPVIYEHPAAGSPDGAPRNSKADQVKNGAGWLNRLNVNADGSVAHVLDITDSEAARKVSEGSIKFTSPEIREVFKDGAGREYRNVFSHFALTHKPRATGQAPLQPVGNDGAVMALQFSLDDAVQFADDEEKDKKKKDEEGGEEAGSDNPFESSEASNDPHGDVAAVEAEEVGPSANPDAPPDPAKADKAAAIVQNMEALGVALPSDFDLKSEGAIDILLAALKTAALAKAESEASENEPGGVEAQEQTAPMQFSVADVEDAKFENKLLAKVVKRASDDLKARITALATSARISTKVRDDLLGIAGSVQFSADADEVPGISISQMVSVLENLPRGTVLGDVDALEHPGGEQFSAEHGGQETFEQAVKTADWIFGKQPQLN